MMSDFVVEVSLPEPHAAARIEEAIRTLGSHFATHAKWRLRDGVYTGSVVVDADNERTALAVVPPGLRTVMRATPAARADDTRASTFRSGIRRWTPLHDARQPADERVPAPMVDAGSLPDRHTSYRA